MLTPVASYGALLGGRVPTLADAAFLLRHFTLAVKRTLGGHVSVDLQQLLLFGHQSDLLFVSQRCAMHKW